MQKLKYNSILFLCLLSTLPVRAGIFYDSLKTPIKKLPKNPSEIYTGQDFLYEEPIKEPGFFSRLYTWIYLKIIELINKLFQVDLRAKDISGREVLWFSLLFLLTIFIIIGGIFFYKKLKGNMDKKDNPLISAEEAEKNIHVVNFDDLINLAVTEQNYKLAIRFYYLKNLKYLSEGNLIQYAYQKTNYEYFYEIQNEDLKGIFKEVSTIFDYCWYGDYTAEETDFLLVKEKSSEIEILITKITKQVE